MKGIKRITLRIPLGLYENLASDETRSINDLIIESVTLYLAQMRRERIDSEFEAMQSDEDYKKTAIFICESFSS